MITFIEGKRHTRMFAGWRDRFDVRVNRASFIIQHVDWGAFLTDVTRTFLERALHDVAHASLIAVRFLERILTRTVRTLRMRRQEQLPAAPLPAPKASLLTETVTYLKTTLRKTRRTPKKKRTLEVTEGDVVEL